MNRVAIATGFALGLLFGLCITFIIPTRISRISAINAGIGLKEESRLYLPPMSIVKDRRPPDRILCWMPVLELDSRLTLIVNETYGRYCDQFYFVAKTGNLSDNVIAHGYERKDRHDLWNQVHRGWARIAEMHLNEYDWFVKLDSDSFFYADNFRYFIHKNDWRPESILYFGHIIFEQSRPINQPRAQFNLGAGYGVSRGLLATVYPYFPTAVNSSIPVNKRCPEWFRWGEDVKFADCLRFALPTLLPNSTRDEYDRETFNPFAPPHHLHSMQPPWYYRGLDPSLVKKQDTLGCCSTRPVLWHKSASWIFALDYLQYQAAVDPAPPSR